MAENPPEKLTSDVIDYLRVEVAKGGFPAASFAIGDGERILAEGACGFAVVEPEEIACSTRTVFDVASLTKPLVTTPLALLAAGEGKLDIDAPASELLPELRTVDKRAITFRDLLSHQAGFRAWLPLYVWGSDLDAYLARIGNERLEYEPRTRVIYSDFSFIALWAGLQRAYGRNAVDLARTYLKRAAVSDSFVIPDHALQPRVAATEWGNETERRMVADLGLAFDRFRDRMIWGEVNDGNAWYAGGFAGNAGLFATACDVVSLASMFLNPGVLSSEISAEATTNQTPGLDENRGLGWQLRSDASGHASAPLSAGSFGHTGFTGASVWVDPVRKLVLALLTNRLHPHASGADMQRIRREFHEVALRAIEG